MVKPLKIGIICERYGAAGGTEILAQRIAEHLALTPAVEAHVLTSTAVPPSPRIGRIIFHILPPLLVPHTFRGLFFARAASRWAAKLKLDLLHTFNTVPGADVVTIGAPHLTWRRDIRSKWQPSFRHRLAGYLERRTLFDSHCRTVLAVSELSRNMIASTYSELTSRLQVAEPGIDIARFVRDDGETLRLETRNELGFGADEYVGIFVGNNLIHKGLTYVLAALERRKAMGRSARLIVLGDGKLNRFRREIAARGLQDDVRLMGRVSENVERYYFAADFFILLSAGETFCIAALEAMSAKLPVIISRKTGIAPTIERTESGIIIDSPADTESVTQAIERLSDPGQRRPFGENGFRAATERDWKIVGNRMLELYLDLAGSAATVGSSGAELVQTL